MRSTWPDPRQRALLSGWGRTPWSAGEVAAPATRRELLASMDDPPPRGLIARGLGRSYGDAAQNAGGRVVSTTAVHELDLDPTTGTVVAGGGVSLDLLVRVLVPRGFFVPVTPGTRHITVGGAIAADIHGKNHHRVGSWMQHVHSLRLLTPDGAVREVGPDVDADLFWATAGGMGLTGTVVDATFSCPRIESSRLLVDTERARDLDDVLHRMTARDHLYDYSVAWIDLMASGAAMGRSVLTRGRFARADELGDAERVAPLHYDPRELVAAPPWVPPGLLNRLSVRAFNELWFRKAPEHRTDELQTISTFFHPLDMVRGWNRMYGTRGFLQWQFVLPLDRTMELRRIVERLSAAGCTSFLAVLKRFGPANPAPLSFPAEGWTLALDIPAGLAGLGPLLDDLDRQVADAGGRVYLAKDGRLDPALVPVMYPRLDEWRAIRTEVDPTGLLRSDLSRRLSL